MENAPRPSCRDDFEIAIICALQLEYNTVSNLFDGYWNDDGDPYGKLDGDRNTYTTGWIGKHNVVLALLPDMGKVSATSIATSVSFSYPRVQLALLVGICGGVPKTGDGTEILLGDVVISQQLVQYDFGRRYPDGFRLKYPSAEEGSGSSNIRQFLNIMQTDRYRSLLPKKALEHLKAAQERYPKKYDYLGAREDKLFRSTYRHKHQISAGCRICNRCTQSSHPTCDVAVKSTCDSLKCDRRHLVRRRRLDRVNGQNASLQATGAPSFIVHFGIMASGDSVMKSALDRDKLAKSHNIIAFEMEGAGIFRSLPCLIIKGVCDYADSHKNKKWQHYAALTAACVMKTLLKWYPSADRRLAAASQPVQDMVKLQQTNQDLQRIVSELRAKLSQLPPQVPCRDLVEVNDALGETYRFSLNFIDSLELFVTVLKRRFEHVGLGKIERREWMLQNHRTGHILNLNKHWKAVVKPGQTLDMSMIFRKRNTLSISCPWCNTENEFPSDQQHVQCRKCEGSYRRIEEVNEIGLEDQDSQQTPWTSSSSLSSSPKTRNLLVAWDEMSWEQKKKEEEKHPNPPATCKKPPQLEEPLDDSDDIHVYTRVQIVDVSFRVVQQDSEDNTSSTHLQLKLNAQDLGNLQRLAQDLAKASGLSEQDCLDALQDAYNELIALRTNKRHAHSLEGVETDTPLETLDMEALRAERRAIFRQIGQAVFRRALSRERG